MKFSFMLMLSLALISCASKPLSDEEKNVRLLRKTDAPMGCKEIKKVYASGFASITEQGHEDDLKRAAFQAGGNTVTLDRVDENRTHYGTVFSCPQPAI